MFALIFGLGFAAAGLMLGHGLGIAAGDGLLATRDVAFWALSAELLAMLGLWAHDALPHDGSEAQQVREAAGRRLEGLALAWCQPSILGHLLLFVAFGLADAGLSSGFGPQRFLAGILAGLAALTAAYAFWRAAVQTMDELQQGRTRDRRAW